MWDYIKIVVLIVLGVLVLLGLILATAFVLRYAFRAESPSPRANGARSETEPLPKVTTVGLSEQLPTSVKYEQVRDAIPVGHGLLGVSANGVETCELKQFMTTLISGGSNSGKSNTVSLKIDEMVREGRDIQLLVIDWHARKEDSLYNRIRCYESRFLRPVAIEEEETLDALKWFYAEFKRRLQMGNAGDNDILLVVDEIPSMMDAEDEEIPKMLKLVARKCGREARGFGMYGFFILQQMIGFAWLRNVVHTVLAHKSGRMNEAMVACNEHPDIARDMENWPKGRVCVYGQNFEGVKVLQVPLFKPSGAEGNLSADTQKTATPF